MNRNMMIVLGGALFVAIFAALLVQSGISSKPEEPKEEIATIEVLVASKDIGVGSEVTSSNMSWKTYREESRFPGAIVRRGEQDVSDALKGRALIQIEEGTPITKSSVVAQTRGNFVAASLEDGKRAFAIKATAETAAGGFISPGDYVDVLMTHRVSIQLDGASREELLKIVSQNASQTIVKNAKVLAIDQESKPTEDAKKVRTVTLEVTPKQAEVLALGGAMGELSVAVRRTGDVSDDKEREGQVTTDAQVSNVIQELLKASDAPDQSLPSQVRLYSGNTIQNIAVRPHKNAPQGNQ